MDGINVDGRLLLRAIAAEIAFYYRFNGIMTNSGMKYEIHLKKFKLFI